MGGLVGCAPAPSAPPKAPGEATGSNEGPRAAVPQSSAPQGGAAADGAATGDSGEDLTGKVPREAEATTDPGPDDRDGAPGSSPSPTTDASKGTRKALPLPVNTGVLHVGDSFAGALGIPLGKRFKAAGLRSILKQETASYIPGWGSGDKLQGYIWKYNPDLVLVTLGANELGIVEPEQRVRNIRKIVEIIGDRPCVWIATPLWNGKQNGLMDVIRDNVAPCHFMDTNVLIDVEAMPRLSDGIHPTMNAREDWADFVLDWLRTHRSPTPQRPWNLEVAD